MKTQAEVMSDKPIDIDMALAQTTLAQYRTLNCQLADGWMWDGYGSDGSVNIKHGTTWQQKYIRTDGTIRDR